MARFGYRILVAGLLVSVGCNGRSGQLIADAGPHSAITASNGLIIWIRDTDESNYPGAINLLPVGGSSVTTLVREGAIWSQRYGNLGQSFAVRGDQVYFPAAYEIDSVPLASPGQFVTAFKAGGYALAANSDHVFWSDSKSITSQSFVDGTSGTIPTTDHIGGPPVASMIADDNQLYYLDTGGLMVAPAAGGAPSLLTAERQGPTHPIYLAGGFVYWLAFDGIAKIATSGGSVLSVASESDFIDHFAIDDEFVYWTSGHTSCSNPDNCPTTYHLRRQPLNGGTSTTLGTLDAQAERIAAAAGHAYVLTPSGLHIF